MVIKTNRFPKPGETILGGDFFMFPGGKGANQAVAAARLGGDVTFIYKTGNDIFGKQATGNFRKERIDTTFACRDESAASGIAVITVNEEGENEIIVASGANNLLSETDIDNANDAFHQTDIVLLQLEIPLSTVAYAIMKAKKLSKKVILNPAPAQSLPDSILNNLHLITPNETEAEILTGVKITDDHTTSLAADKLLEKGVKNVIITLGSRGAFYKNSGNYFFVNAPMVKAIDTTAAGDVFNGVIAVALAENKEWKEAIEFACKAASLSVTRMGAQSSAPFLNELMPSL
jgi:ribokinase